MIFDTHCHLGHDEEDPAAIAACTGRATAAAVSRLLTVGIDLATSRRAATIAATHPTVLHSAGLHPNSADRLAAEWDALSALCRDAACVAIGETGLDYFWDRTTRAQQQASLRAHLELADELGKPVIIHTRDAFADIFDELAAFPEVGGVLHCFSGGVDEARRGLALGYYLSFAGPLTYPKNDALREAAAFAPEDRILVETDAPFLPPQRVRGETNEPAYIVETLTRLAAVRGIPFEAAAAITMRNGCRLFGLD